MMKTMNSRCIDLFPWSFNISSVPLKLNCIRYFIIIELWKILRFLIIIVVLTELCIVYLIRTSLFSVSIWFTNFFCVFLDMYITINVIKSVIEERKLLPLSYLNLFFKILFRLFSNWRFESLKNSKRKNAWQLEDLCAFL